MRTASRNLKSKIQNPKSAGRAFTLLEVMTAIFILGILFNLIFVCYVRADRQATLASRALDRVLSAQQTMDYLRDTVRRAQAGLDAHGRYRSGRDVLVLRNARGQVVVFTRQGTSLAEIDPLRSDGEALLKSAYAADIQFDYGGRPPADARAVTWTFTLEPVWPDTVDRVVLRSTAALRAPGEGPPSSAREGGR